MALQEYFYNAAERVKELPKRPENEYLLQLYAYFKQTLEGDAQGDRPGFADFEGRAKFDAWSKQKGMTKEEAQQAYIELVEELEKAQGVG